MVNAALVLKGQEGMFSTMDICAVDLYTGICSFLKAGASATFIKRDHWVEAISSESLAAGLLQQIDFDTSQRKLYHGDYLIMMTDGVLDALPRRNYERDHYGHQGRDSQGYEQRNSGAGAGVQ